MLNNKIADREKGVLLRFKREQSGMGMMPLAVNEFYGVEVKGTNLRKGIHVPAPKSKVVLDEKEMEEYYVPMDVTYTMCLYGYDKAKNMLNFIACFEDFDEKSPLVLKAKKGHIVLKDDLCHVELDFKVGTVVSLETCREAFKYTFDELAKVEGTGKLVLLVKDFQRQAFGVLADEHFSRMDEEIRKTAIKETAELLYEHQTLFEILPGQRLLLLDPTQWDMEGCMENLSSVVVVCSEEDLGRFKEFIEKVEKRGIPVKVFS